MAAHTMSMRPESGLPSPAAIRNREVFASSPIWETLFPIRYTDPHHSLEQADAYLETGGSVVYVITHPSLEDAVRIARLLAKRLAIRQRRVLAPVAIHQLELVQTALVPWLEFDTVPIVTEHSRDRRAYPKETVQTALAEYVTQMNDVLSDNGAMMIAFQADQASKLFPSKAPVLDFIIRRTDRAGIHRVAFTFIGIEIDGMEDYAKARHVALKRHLYTFHVGDFFLKEDVKRLSLEEGLTPDQWGYKQLFPLVPATYRSE